MRTARRGPSGHGSGSLKMTISPSPAKRSSVPSKRWMRSPRAAWYWLSTSIRSSGSTVSANAPKPPDPLQCVDLFLHPLLELPVPGRELDRLTLDRVVVSLDPQQRADAREQFGVIE